TALASPRGTPTASAIAVTRNVPDSRGRMPKLLSAKSGVQRVEVKNSPKVTARSAKNAAVSPTSAATTPKVVSTESAAQARSSARTAPSRARAAGASRSGDRCLVVRDVTSGVLPRRGWVGGGADPAGFGGRAQSP